MKKIILMLLAVFFHPGVFAQPAIDYDQAVYVFRLSPLAVSLEEYLEIVADCNELIADTGLGGSTIYIDPFTNDIAATMMLQSIHTKKTNGSVKKPIKKIGEMLVCQDWTDVSPENNFIPSFVKVNIDGMNLVAEGGGISPIFNQLPGGGQIMAPTGYPAPFVFPVNFSATILPSLPKSDGQDNPLQLSDGSGGTMTINSIINFGDNPQFETDGIGVIRFFNPIVD